MAIANCAKMHIPPSEARTLAWWEYQALIWQHQPDDTQEAEAPDGDFVAARQQRLADRGLAKTVH